MANARVLSFAQDTTVRIILYFPRRMEVSGATIVVKDTIHDVK